MSEDKDSESSSDSGSADASSDSCQFSDIEEFSKARSEPQLCLPT